MNYLGQIKKAILSKFLWIVLSFVILYLVGIGFGFVPQYMVDMVNWGGTNFEQIVILTAILSTVYLTTLFLNRKKGEEQ